MNKKILTILTLLIIVASATAVSAAADNNTVKVDDFEFSLPDGFTEDPTEEVVNQPESVGSVEYTVCQKLFEKGTTYVSILVGDYGENKVSDEIVQSIGGEKTTLNGVDGYMAKEKGIYAFSYAKNDKLVTITSTDESVIKDFIIKE